MRRHAWWMVVVTLAACALDSGDGRNGGGTGGAGGGGGTFVDAGAVDGGSACGLPFDPGPCDAAFRAFAFVPALGACYPHLWGGCGGNANRFNTLEECEAQCGVVSSGGCPPNRVLASVCVECGPAGGCGSFATGCAPLCDDALDCPVTTAGPVGCFNGVCQLVGCD